MPPDPSTAAQRLFVALWPDDAVRDAMGRYQAAWQWPPHAALVSRDRLHITLHFLGNVAAAAVPLLCRALRVPFEPFSLELEAHVWDKGLAVLEAPMLPVALSDLHLRLGRALTQAGVALEDRKYRPHLTLARRARGAKAPAEPATLRWEIQDGYVLVRSLPGGAGYQVLERFSA